MAKTDIDGARWSAERIRKAVAELNGHLRMAADLGLEVELSVDWVNPDDGVTPRYSWIFPAIRLPL